MHHFLCICVTLCILLLIFKPLQVFTQAPAPALPNFSLTSTQFDQYCSATPNSISCGFNRRCKQSVGQDPTLCTLPALGYMTCKVNPNAFSACAEVSQFCSAQPAYCNGIETALGGFPDMKALELKIQTYCTSNKNICDACVNQANCNVFELINKVCELNNTPVLNPAPQSPPSEDICLMIKNQCQNDLNKFQQFTFLCGSGHGTTGYLSSSDQMLHHFSVRLIVSLLFLGVSL